MTENTELPKRQKKQNLVSLTVFSISLVVVSITLITVMFPAFLMGYLGEGPKYPVEIDPFETGIRAFPLLLANFTLLGLGILYIKNKLPQLMVKAIKFIFNFEISARVSFLVIATLVGIYISFNVSEILMEDIWPDFNRVVKSGLEEWTIQEFIERPFKPNVVSLLANVSMKVFETYRVIPFIASIALLLLTYFITIEISKKRFAGIVSMVIVMQSTNFLIYDSTVTYTNFWVLFYLISLYTIIKKWYLSPIAFILSIPSKALTVFFLPMTLFFIYRADTSRKQKIMLFISYGTIIVLGITAVYVIDPDIRQTTEFSSHAFWSGFTAFSSEFRDDWVIVIFLLPVIVGLFLASRKGMLYADSFLILITGMLLIAPILPSITLLTNNPYRFIPLVVFFAIGVGTILSSKRTIKEQV